MPPYIFTFQTPPNPSRRPTWLNFMLLVGVLLLAAVYSWLQAQVKHPHTLLETALQAFATVGFLFCVALSGRLSDFVWR